MRLLTLFSIFLCLFLFTGTAHALTVEDIIILKKYGVSDKIIRKMIESEMQEREINRTSIRIEETEDAIIYSTGQPFDSPLYREYRMNKDDAWEMLKNLEIEIE